MHNNNNNESSGGSKKFYEVNKLDLCHAATWQFLLATLKTIEVAK